MTVEEAARTLRLCRAHWERKKVVLSEAQTAENIAVAHALEAERAYHCARTMLQDAAIGIDTVPEKDKAIVARIVAAAG